VQRRLFVVGAAYTVIHPFALARPRLPAVKTDNKTCTDPGDSPANLQIDHPNSDMDKNYPLPKLTPYKDFKLTLNYIDSFWNPWKHFTAEKARLERGVQLMNAVWSSVEFKNAVTNVTWPLQWEHPNKKPSEQIKGEELYGHLMSNSSPTVDATIVYGKAAAASIGNLISYRNPAIKRSSVYTLCNTTSHEFTHLDITGVSTDNDYGDLPDASLFVSYGIGGLTEELAAGARIYSCDLYPWPQAAGTPITTTPKPKSE
jgi:hypothetical protein